MSVVLLKFVQKPKNSRSIGSICFTQNLKIYVQKSRRKNIFVESMKRNLNNIRIKVALGCVLKYLTGMFF
jgi:hypothetical protein